MNAQGNDEGLDFIGSFVNDQFKRQINEHLRNKVKEEETFTTQALLRKMSSFHEDNLWSVRYNSEYLDYVLTNPYSDSINRQKLKDLPELFEMTVKTETAEDYCWAVCLWKPICCKAHY